MRRHIPIILFSVVTILVVIALRIAVFDIITIPHDGEEPTLIQGDRVLVNKWAYGLRHPFAKSEYRRFRPHPARRGDWIVINTPSVERGARPDTSSLCIGYVLSCPGDTIWMGNKGHVSSRRNYRHGCIWPMVVPAKGTHVQLSPWNMELYAITIQRHEEQLAMMVDTALYVDGKATDYYRFNRDYYWVMSGNDKNLYDSRTFGFVPEEHMVGQAVSVLYSLDRQQPWYKRLRTNRIFKPIG